MNGNVGIRSLAGVTLLLVLTAGCGKQPPTRAQSEGMTVDVPSRSGPTRAVSGTIEERRADLLNRIRAADPRQETVQRALINENNELGLILTRQTNLDDVPKLMKPMLAEMDKAFPGKDHTIIAYTPTNPPRRIGTARLNARTRDMTYTPESP
jgi:hypothetical protein